MNKTKHICEEYLDSHCRCKMCGRSCHAWEDDDDGSFAASGKVVTARCTRCGTTERYYSDSGTVIDGADTPEGWAAYKARETGPEMVCLVEERDGRVYINGMAERGTAELDGLRHLTVIVVPFIAAGPYAGCWVVHNRFEKQLAKGKPCPPLSLNLFGGHYDGAGERMADLIGYPVPERLLRMYLLREMSEELYTTEISADTAPIMLERRLNGSSSPDGGIRAHPYASPLSEPIPAGYTVYTSKSNLECSYIYALPIPGMDAEKLIAADDYRRADGTKGDLLLPVILTTEAELRRQFQSGDPEIEVCDAITRLWEKQNAGTHEKLLRIIHAYLM